MNTFMKGDDAFPSRDWSMLPNALATLESIIHPQNKIIFDLLLTEGEVEHHELLQKTGLNPRQFKRRIDRLLKYDLIHKFSGISQTFYAIKDSRMDMIYKNSITIIHNTLSVI